MDLQEEPASEDPVLLKLRKYHEKERLKPGTYANRLLNTHFSVSCYDCQRSFSSQRGFQIHWEKTDHYPVPVEYVNYYDEDSEVDEEEHVEVVVGSKVKLLQDDLYIGSGVINSLFSEQRQVHNHDMVKDEVVILMKQLEIKTIKHPIYNYTLEIGSFTAWKLRDLEVIVS
ncbi:uncharacterized protein LOC135343700 isoform X1 [Halichondria panicea]|uniref:uncharacterized protein LOC135343700 isoform X1 n=1 Tax=Halichondria panicea TaxID=6063 RepID=UPI00312B9606